jgi:hypothetical protein
MTTEEFWNGEPRVLSSFIKKHELELDEMNKYSWLIGLYTYKAVGVVVSNALSGKNSVKQSYFEKPLEEFSSNYNKNAQTKQAEEEHRKTVNYWAKYSKKGV